VYGNMLENYATLDRYKFLLTTNNNALYTYIENKRQDNQTCEQIISDLHMRYLKNAMSKSGLNILDSNLSTFDYQSDVRKFLKQFVPQNLIDIVISDYNELTDSIDFDILRDLLEHKFQESLETYVPEYMRNNLISCANMIASITQVIMSNAQIKKTYDAYSSKMKQTYINSLIDKIEKGNIPSVNLDNDQMNSRIIDYLSFSIKGQNVIIQAEDDKYSGLGTYPRSIYFKQKENADNSLRTGKILSFEQNEIITTRNDTNLINNDVVNLFGSLYKFNGAYNKILLKLKPYPLTGGVKFMENLVDALNEKIDIKVTSETSEGSKVVIKNTKLSNEERTFDYEDENWFVRKGFVLNKSKVKEYYLLIAFGFKYGLDRNKEKLKKDFYTNNILSLNKINETFKDQSEEMINLITLVIRDVMMTSCDRVIDYINLLNNKFEIYFNKMLYINRLILDSNIFDTKTDEEKLTTLNALELDFVTKAEDIITPHLDIYSSIEEIERYENLYLYYSLTALFEKLSLDERFITKELSEYFEDVKKKIRNKLLDMIKERIPLNGYEQNLAKYFELKLDNLKEIETSISNVEELTEKTEQKDVIKLENIDVVFKGILDGFRNALKNQDDYIKDLMNDVGNTLEYVGELPMQDISQKDLEIYLPNNQKIICNVKGLLQQYLFRYIIDNNHDLGPFAYVINELNEQEDLSDIVRNIDSVAEKLNAPELGINLIAKFSSINLSDKGNVLKFGENISTVVNNINKIDNIVEQQNTLNRDAFYKEGVEGVKTLFEQYFNRIKSEKLDY
ncbi:MAG: hypothetical protein ACI4PF_04505, partial [Christensenellales bacterium]